MLRSLFPSPRRRKPRQVAPCQALECRVVPSGTSEGTGEGTTEETDGASPTEPLSSVQLEYVMIGLKSPRGDVAGKPPVDPHSPHAGFFDTDFFYWP